MKVKFIATFILNKLGLFLLMKPYLIGGLNRNEHDNLVMNYIGRIIKTRDELPSVGAVYRVKNGESFISASILSIAPICKEIIVVDNNSSDRTIEIVEGLKLSLSKITEIKIFKYENELIKAGVGYKKQLKANPSGSLANYYKFCFSKCSCDYLFKVDAHLIFTPLGLNLIQNKIKMKIPYIRFRCDELYGAISSFEPSIFHKNSGWKFVDGELYEVLTFNKINIIKKLASFIFRPVSIHIKRIKYIEDVCND